MKTLNLLYSALILSLMCSCTAFCKTDEKKKQKKLELIATEIKFQDVTEQLGFKGLGNAKAAWADLDDDGWVDLVSKGKIWKNLKGKKFHSHPIGS